MAIAGDPADSTAQDASELLLLPEEPVNTPPAAARSPAPDAEAEADAAAAALLPDSSFAMDHTADHDMDDSLTEAAVREHLKDVESSFLPALSPIPTGSVHIDGGVDDTYLFDSPNKAAMQMPLHPRLPPPAAASTRSARSSPGPARRQRRHLDRWPRKL
jgi:hypothetical protein